MQWSLAMNLDGSLLYAVNPATGAAAVVTNGDNGAPGIARTTHFARATSTAAGTEGANTAVGSSGTLIAGGPAGLTGSDHSSLKVGGRTGDGRQHTHLGPRPGGQ